MRKYFYSLFIALLLWGVLIISPATVFAQSGCVCAGCGKTCDEIRKSGHKPGCPYAPKNSASTPTYSGSSYYGGGHSMQMQMIQGILSPVFNSLFTISDTSEEQFDQQAAEQKRKEEEMKKQAAIKRWLDLQKEEALNREMEKKSRITQGGKLISQMQTVGNQGKLEPFSWGKPLEPEPLSIKAYPTAQFSDWERLLCSAYFSNMAKQSTTDVDGRFYADQAQRVMAGEPTYIECKIPQVSSEKFAKKMAEVKKAYEAINVKIKDLQALEDRIAQTVEKIKNAESKREEAAAKLNELQSRAAAALPEEKAEVDSLLLEAQKQLQDAEQELSEAKQSQSDDLVKKEELIKELESLRSQTQAKIEAGDQ